MDQPRASGTPARTRMRIGAGIGIGIALILLLASLLLLRSPGRSDPPRGSGTQGTDTDLASSATTPGGNAPGTDAASSVPDPSAPSSPPAAVSTPIGAVEGPFTIELIDTSRRLVSGGIQIDTVRRLPTRIWRPTAPGHHPLVVFAHGYQVGPMTYARFCADLAAQGYVVAAPSFPLADESRGNGLDREDIPEETGDINFIIARLRASDSTISTSISDDPVTVIGHSDGATVALLVAGRPGSMNPVVGAVIAIAPDTVTGDLSSTPPPVLIIHGTADPIAAFSDAQGDFDRFSGSRFLLALEGADHLAPIVGGTPWTPVIDRAVRLFLAAVQAHRGPADAGSLTTELDRLDLSHVLHAG